MLKKSTFLILFLISVSVFTLSAETIETEMLNAGFNVFKEKVSSIDFSLENLEGSKVNLKDFRGKVVMLNFWATWCPPCRREMPSMEKLYSRIDRNKIDIAAVNIQEKKETVSDFVSQNNYTFPVLIDEEGKAASIYQIRSIPTTFIVDKAGYIRAQFIGTREWNEKDIISIFNRLAAE